MIGTIRVEVMVSVDIGMHVPDGASPALVQACAEHNADQAADDVAEELAGIGGEVSAALRAWRWVVMPTSGLCSPFASAVCEVMP